MKTLEVGTHFLGSHEEEYRNIVSRIFKVIVDGEGNCRYQVEKFLEKTGEVIETLEMSHSDLDTYPIRSRFDKEEIDIAVPAEKIDALIEALEDARENLLFPELDYGSWCDERYIKIVHRIPRDPEDILKRVRNIRLQKEMEESVNTLDPSDFSKLLEKADMSLLNKMSTRIKENPEFAKKVFAILEEE